MIPRLLLVFGASVALAAAATPLARWLAHATSCFDQPPNQERSVPATPCLGGLAILAATILALSLGPGLGLRAGVLALGACVLGAVGLADDRRNLSLRLRVAVQLAVAVATIMAGISVHVTGWLPVDLAITVLWIVGITNALNLLDNVDGLAGGISFVASLAVFVLALEMGQQAVATFAAGLAGASLGFLFYNGHRASIYMGDAGSLVLGYLLAVITIEVDPPLAAPKSLILPLLLLALPLADTTTVVFKRLANGRPVAQGGKDHLSHRHVARGVTPLQAVAMLIFAQALIACLGVLAGLRILPVAGAVAGTALVLAAVVMPAVRSRVYPTAQRLRARAMVVLGVGAVGAMVVVGLMAYPDPIGTQTLWVSESNLQPGQAVEVAGDGYAPGTEVTLSIGGVSVAGASADDDGRLHVQTTVPRGLDDGRHTLEVRAGADVRRLGISVGDGLAGDGNGDRTALLLLLGSGAGLVAVTFWGVVARSRHSRHSPLPAPLEGGHQ